MLRDDDTRSAAESVVKGAFQRRVETGFFGRTYQVLSNLGNYITNCVERAVGNGQCSVRVGLKGLLIDSGESEACHFVFVEVATNFRGCEECKGSRMGFLDVDNER